MLLNRLSRSSKARPLGTPRPRPTARLSLESLGDRIVPAQLSVGNAVILEGHAGIRYALMTVTLDDPGKKTVTVNYATAGGSATVGSDYGAVSGKLTFASGQTSKTIQVPVIGDRVAEPDEYFLVQLSNPSSGVRIANGGGGVTIVDDEPRVSVGDAAGTVAVSGGTTVGTTLSFTVSLAAPYDQAVTINYATADGTAVAGVDYLATSGTLTFAPGETTKIVTVDVVGNAYGGDEWFYVNLGGASGAVQIVDGQGVGTIDFHVVQDPGDPGDGCSPDGPYFCP